MKVAVYARVSSEDQQDRGTIENQLEFARKYCDLHQLNVVEWYKDNGITGTIPLDEREDGARLLKDAYAGQFDLLLVYRLDRLGRSARIILNSVYELEQHGVTIRSMSEPFDTGNPNGRFMLTILAGVADLERETILERMWHGANRAARSGKWLGGIVPYGYRTNQEGYLEVNEDPLPDMDISEADVIRLIYRLITTQRYSTIKVADYLNSLGIPPSYKKDGRQVKRGKRKVNTAGMWSPSRIRNMVVNSTYKGIHHYGKRTTKERNLITREVPAIVSEEVWKQAQQVLKDNHIEADRNSRRKYLLRSLIKCEQCGRTYVGVSYPGSKRKPKAYYVCGGKHAYRGPLNEKCRSKNVPQQWLEDTIWNQCVAFILSPGEAIKELSASMEEKRVVKTDLSSEKELIEQTLQEKDREKQSILDLFRKQLISNQDVELQLQKIRKEQSELRKRINEIDQERQSQSWVDEQFNSAEELLNNLREKLAKEPTFEDRRAIVKSLVKEVRVHTHLNETGRKVATVFVKFSFGNDTLRTDRDSSIQPT
ncbi:serine recombinase [Marinithermofilum abyssi]|uniref:Serine recombinase n=1 Tax=Marinithermofilum abyssi TaxID=1571185 RepID=A0A8J2VHX8_9BACL|nr:recombinase family protein [Marinithermofilum abyssi]GGE16376.1 serine recombinase [Marinithermofilum abyssi]